MSVLVEPNMTRVSHSNSTFLTSVQSKLYVFSLDTPDYTTTASAQLSEYPLETSWI